VITLTGRLEFETRAGTTQVIEPGDILLADDTTGLREDPCSRPRQR
jgi:hypothetical protein